MTYESFKTRLTARLSSELPSDTRITQRRITKNNNLILDGLVISRENVPLSPTIYLNEYYTACNRDSVPFDDLIADILARCRDADTIRRQDFTAINDFDKIKSNVVFRLVNEEKNRPLLADLAYLPYLDLAITFVLLLSIHEDNDAIITVKEEHLKMWGLSKEELFSHTKKNTPKKLPAKMQHLAELLPPISEDEEPLMPRAKSMSFPMYLLSNEFRTHGAGCLLYDGLLSDIAETLGGDFTVLPSSIHEVLLVPQKYTPDKELLSAMITEVNRDAVAADEYLSDHAYFYDAASDTLSY